eukprot:COSAG04_NODE_17543_length_466_cov_1.005450_1_plen_93_part_10
MPDVPTIPEPPGASGLAIPAVLQGLEVARVSPLLCANKPVPEPATIGGDALGGFFITLITHHLVLRHHAASRIDIVVLLCQLPRHYYFAARGV